MRINADLEIALSVALTEAARRGHAFAGLEHLLLALLIDDATRGVLASAGADVAALRRRVDGYLEASTDDELPVDPDLADEPRMTVGLRRVLSRAAAHTEGAGKAELGPADVLVALYDEDDSEAAAWLAESGATRLDVVSFLAHGGRRHGGRGRAYGAAGARPRRRPRVRCRGRRGAGAGGAAGPPRATPGRPGWRARRAGPRPTGAARRAPRGRVRARVMGAAAGARRARAGPTPGVRRGR